MIKKLALIFALVTIGFTGVALAAGIPEVTSPRDSSEYWTMKVYNNASADLDAGDVVIWDIDSSTGDNDMYVTTTTTQGTGPVAGVVLNAITDGDVGTIVVYGVTTVDTDPTAGVGAVGIPMGTSGVVGNAQPCDAADYYLGFSLVATSSNSTTVFVCPGRQ